MKIGVLSIHCIGVKTFKHLILKIQRKESKVQIVFFLQNEIIQESTTMVNDCRRRLEAAYQEMVQILVNMACI